MSTTPTKYNKPAERLADGNERHAAALTYADRGYLVFPLRPRGKEPLAGSHGLLDATTDRATIERWWSAMPCANVAIATGAESGVVVLDIDPRNGGDDTLADLEREFGELPETARSLTGGGGVHYFFQHPGGHVKSGSNVLGPGIDVKADGGYVVAPPSTHPNGRAYTRDGAAHPDDVPLAALPDWIVAKLTARPRCNDAHPTAAGLRVGTVGEGGRNNFLTSRAGTLRRSGFSEAAIFAAIQVENEERCEPQLPEPEVRQIAASIASYPPGEAPRPSTCDGRCENAETLRALRAISGNPGLKAGVARTAIQAVFAIQGRTGEDGYAKLHLAPIAEATGQSVNTVSNHVKALERVGVFKKYISTRYDEDAGAYRSAVFLKSGAGETGEPVTVAAALKPLALVQVGRLSPEKTMPPACRVCGDVGTKRRRELQTTVFCRGCGDCLTGDDPIVTRLTDVITPPGHLAALQSRDTSANPSESKKLGFTLGQGTNGYQGPQFFGFTRDQDPGNGYYGFAQERPSAQKVGGLHKN